MKVSTFLGRLFGYSLPLTAFPHIALAHHPLAGAPMTTLQEGLLSGIGHPILGLDHLFFILLVGVIAFNTKHRWMAPLGYVLSMLAGCVVAYSFGVFQFAELVIMLSLLVTGMLLLRGTRLSKYTVVFCFVFFGMFHGMAFSSALASQEMAVGGDVLMGYLVGLGITQYLLAVGFAVVTGKLMQRSETPSLVSRLAGAMVFGVGAFLLLEHVEPHVISLILI